MTAVSVSQWPLAGRGAELEAARAAWELPRCRGGVRLGCCRGGQDSAGRGVHEQACGQGPAHRAGNRFDGRGRVPLGAIAHLIPAGVDLSDPVRGFAEVARVLAGPGRGSLWVLLLDDLHLLDAASALLVRQLMDPNIVRLIATIRTGEPLGDAVSVLQAGGRCTGSTSARLLQGRSKRFSRARWVAR